MKKQLLRGLSLVAGALVLTACSSEYDFETKHNTETERETVFNEIFVDNFGTPDAYHTWGFETPEVTRAVNKNGNQWHDANYFNLEYDPVVTEEEKLGVFNYVNKDVENIKTVEQEDWSEYWISQVWDGAQDKAGDTMSPRSVPFTGEDDAIAGASYMDYLHVKESESQGDDIASWTHFNDFNNANNEGNYEGGKLYMYKSGTLSFGYHNSYSSYYSDKYIVVSGATIFGENSEYANYYYVCFDFEGSMQPEQTVISFDVDYKHVWTENEGEGSGSETKSGENLNVTIDGLYKAEDITDDMLLEAFRSKYHDSEDDGNGWAHTYSVTGFSNVGVSQYVNGNKHFDGDDNYTDWIVRISPAKTKTTEYYSRRVIAEDLGTAEATDFDYNDVVFDVVQDESNTTVTLRAAGGTLPLYLVTFDGIDTDTKVNNFSPTMSGIKWIKEVHEWFGVATTTMVNTNNGTVSCEPQKEVFSDELLYAAQVRIFVYKNGYYEITAYQGKPAQKLAVGTDYKWLDERVSIINQSYYGNFLEYVNDQTVFGDDSYKLWYTKDPQKADAALDEEHQGTIGL